MNGFPRSLTFVKNKYAWFYGKFAVLHAGNPYDQQLIEEIDGITIDDFNLLFLAITTEISFPPIHWLG